MSWEELETVFTYLDPHVDVVSLLGGEPTLHSKFKEIVTRVSNKGYSIKIFTNGATAALRGIHGIAPDEIRIILNLNEPDTYNANEWKQIEKNCTLFKDQIALSFNVFKPDFSWDYLKEAILQWGLNHFVRIGMAQPIKGMNNAFLQEKDLRAASSRLVNMAEDLATHGISIGFDCGFRPWTFTQEELGILAECGTHFLFVCKPVIDIGPQLMTWRCFPFSVGPGVKLTDFASMKELAQYFTEKWSSIQEKGNTDACSDCSNMKTALCSGGCLSRSFVNSSVQIKF
jgi:organic radical activating enzyme